MPYRAVIALGGNALIRDNHHIAFADQYATVRETMVHLTDLIQHDWNVVLTHGNGPQVGFLLRQSELAAHEIPPLPLDYCDAATQGDIGYMLQHALNNLFRERGLPHQAVTVVTEVVVSADDPAFAHPSKPIGSFMSAETAEQHRDRDGWAVVEDAGRGWRRVVASPHPKEIVQLAAVDALSRAGFVVVAVGGGGIPVVRQSNGLLRGVEAVIDKDRASALLAVHMRADWLIILTDVPQVAVHFRQPNQRWLDTLTLAEAERYLAEGHFAGGSMGPKVEAALAFVRHTGGSALITDPAHLAAAVRGQAGTRLVP